MKYKKIIFDFDGTLTDTNGIYAREFVKIAKATGFDDTFENAYLWIAKYSIPYAISQHQWGPDYREKIAEYRRMRNESVLNEAVPMVGAKELLEYIICSGGQNYLFTDNNSVAYDCLTKWGMNNYFSGMVFCASESLPLKPSSEGMKYLLNKYDLLPSECLIIGDRDADIISGQGAEVDGVLVDPYGYYPDLKPKYRADSLNNIIDIIRD